MYVADFLSATDDRQEQGDTGSIAGRTSARVEVLEGSVVEPRFYEYLQLTVDPHYPHLDGRQYQPGSWRLHLRQWALQSRLRHRIRCPLLLVMERERRWICRRLHHKACIAYSISFEYHEDPV